MCFPQRCKVCGKADGIDFQVNDGVWEAVVPKEYVNRVVCLPCFDNFASLRGIDYADGMDREMHFVGQAAHLTFEIRGRIAASGLRRLPSL